jgi:hypothetical protein
MAHSIVYMIQEESGMLLQTLGVCDTRERALCAWARASMSGGRRNIYILEQQRDADGLFLRAHDAVYYHAAPRNELIAEDEAVAEALAAARRASPRQRRANAYRVRRRFLLRVCRAKRASASC